MDFTQLLGDPNVQQYMGQVGKGMASGERPGVYLDPTNMIRNIASQKVGGAQMQTNANLRSALMSVLTGTYPTNTTTPVASGGTSQSGGGLTLPSPGIPMALVPTPPTEPGPNSVTQDANGTTIKYPSASSIDMARAKAGMGAYGTNKSPESFGGNRGGSRTNFYQALLGQDLNLGM